MAVKIIFSPVQLCCLKLFLLDQSCASCQMSDNDVWVSAWILDPLRPNDYIHARWKEHRPNNILQEGTGDTSYRSSCRDTSVISGDSPDWRGKRGEETIGVGWDSSPCDEGTYQQKHSRSQGYSTPCVPHDVQPASSSLTPPPRAGSKSAGGSLPPHHLQPVPCSPKLRLCVSHLECTRPQDRTLRIAWRAFDGLTVP